MAEIVKQEDCFICNETIVGVSTNIVSACTLHTNTLLINKLSNFIGNEYIVIVTEDDYVCSNCVNLFNEMDKLENQLELVKSILNNYLTNKCGLSSENTKAKNDSSCSNNILSIEENKNNCSKSENNVTNILNNKTGSKHIIKKIFHCNICEVNFVNSDINYHVEQDHLIIEKIKTDTTTTDFYKCSVCKKRYTDENFCKQHIKNEHVINVKKHTILNESDKRFITKDFSSENNVEINVVSSKQSSVVTNINKSNLVNIKNCEVDSSNKNNFIEENKIKEQLMIGKYISNNSKIIHQVPNDNKNLFKCQKCGNWVDQYCKPCKDSNHMSKDNQIDISSNENHDDVNMDNETTDGRLITSNNLTPDHMIIKFIELLDDSKENQTLKIGENDQLHLENAVNNSSECCSDKSKINNIPELHFTNIDSKNNNINKKYTCFNCTLCNINLDSESSLIQHNETFHKNSISCCICRESFTSISNVNSHILVNHPNWKEFRCFSCNIDFKKNLDIVNHIKSVHLSDKLCTICGKSFRTNSNFIQHIEYGHREDLNCSVCNKMFSELKKLINHEKNHDKHKYKCDICNKILKTRSGIRNHKMLHTGNYPFICEFCGKGYASVHSLNEHKGKHIQESRYICEICGKGFRFYDTYHKHRRHHDNPYPNQCDICKQNFRSASRVAEHKRKKHTFERPYKCPYCPLSFHISNLLKHHSYVHTKQYPFTCALCKKGFPARHKHALHMFKKHKDDSFIKNKLPNNKEKFVESLKLS